MSSFKSVATIALSLWFSSHASPLSYPRGISGGFVEFGMGYKGGRVRLDSFDVIGPVPSLPMNGGNFTGSRFLASSHFTPKGMSARLSFGYNYTFRETLFVLGCIGGGEIASWKGKILYPGIITFDDNRTTYATEQTRVRGNAAFQACARFGYWVKKAEVMPFLKVGLSYLRTATKPDKRNSHVYYPSMPKWHTGVVAGIGCDWITNEVVGVGLEVEIGFYQKKIVTAYAMPSNLSYVKAGITPTTFTVMLNLKRIFPERPSVIE